LNGPIWTSQVDICLPNVSTSHAGGPPVSNPTGPLGTIGCSVQGYAGVCVDASFSCGGSVFPYGCDLMPGTSCCVNFIGNLVQPPPTALPPVAPAGQVGGICYAGIFVGRCQTLGTTCNGGYYITNCTDPSVVCCVLTRNVAPNPTTGGPLPTSSGSGTTSAGPSTSGTPPASSLGQPCGVTGYSGMCYYDYYPNCSKWIDNAGCYGERVVCCIGSNASTQPPAADSGMPLWLLILFVVGGLILVLIAIILVVFILRRRRNASSGKVSRATSSRSASVQNNDGYTMI